MLQLAALNEPDAPPEPTFLYNRATELEDIGRFREARETYLQGVAASRRSGARELTTVGFVGLASVSLDLGDLGAAGGYLADASTNVTAEASPSVRAVTKLQLIRGAFALKQGRVTAARADLDTAIESGKNVYWKTRALLVRSEINLTDNKLDAARADANTGVVACASRAGDDPVLKSDRTGLAHARTCDGQTRRRCWRRQRRYQAAINNLSNTVDANHPKLALASRLAHSEL